MQTGYDPQRPVLCVLKRDVVRIRYRQRRLAVRVGELVELAVDELQDRWFRRVDRCRA